MINITIKLGTLNCYVAEISGLCELMSLKRSFLKSEDDSKEMTRTYNLKNEKVYEVREHGIFSYIYTYKNKIVKCTKNSVTRKFKK